MRVRILLFFALPGLLLTAACDAPPWEMPCSEGWVMDADQNCYDPAADDDSAGDDDTTAT